jgi:hypothetical protein
MVKTNLGDPKMKCAQNCLNFDNEHIFALHVDVDDDDDDDGSSCFFVFLGGDLGFLCAQTC